MVENKKYLKRRIVIYHDQCFDGMTAAWILWCLFGDKDTDYHAGGYNGVLAAFPDTDAEELYIVDYSYPRAIIEREIAKRKKVVVLDHHKSALVLEGLPGVHLDMNRSGAGITYDYAMSHLHDFVMMLTPESNKTLSDFISLVQDRDLFKFENPDSRAFTCRMSVADMTLQGWNELYTCFAFKRENFMAEGRAIEAHFDRNIDKFIKNNLIWVKLFGRQIPVLNLPKEYGSDSCKEMLTRFPEAPFAMYYYEDSESWTKGPYIGIRARKGDTVDVTPLAEHFGGGGHRDASAFRVPFDRLRMLEYDNVLPTKMNLPIIV